jgi:hypothetical protein
MSIFQLIKYSIILSSHYRTINDAYNLLYYINKILPMIKYLRSRVQKADPIVIKLITIDDII